MVKKKDNSWKIINKEPLGSYSLRNILRLLVISKFKISLRYVPRFLWAILLSSVTLPLRVIEKIRFNKKIKTQQIEKDPIFIIGFYRTGTTFLHTLLSLDDRLGYMSNLDGLIPLFNLSFSKLARRLLKKSLPKTRPMDNIEYHLDGPVEEEYAVSTCYENGITNAIIFPKKFNYFTEFLFFDRDPLKVSEKWQKIYHYFIQKCTLKNNGKQLALKNPANSCRIKLLLKMYPNAKFIYTYRNPYTLFCSMKLPILMEEIMS